MARPRIFISLVIALPIVLGLSRVYKPHLGVRLGAFVDVALVLVLAFVITRIIQRFEE